MRFWDVSGAEVEAADAAPWDMPFSGMARPFGSRSIVRLLLAAAFQYGSTGVTGFFYAVAVDDAVGGARDWMLFFVVAAGLSVGVVGLLLALPAGRLQRLTPTIAVLLLAITPVIVCWGMASAGPAFALAALATIQTPFYAFYVLYLRWAVLQSAWLLVCVAVVVQVQDGWVASWWAWLWVAVNVIGSGVVGGLAAARSDDFAAAEHEARVEVAQLNHTLEDRVEVQVAEIERLSGLRRFLSTQVADVVLAGDTQGLTIPHRARIAVFFCDLRGFTAFTNNAEPEEVVGILDEYYGAVGGLLRQYDATVGDYAGDGIMAYFGDPVPRADAALSSVAMAQEVGAAMAPVIADWHRRGYDLGYGVGLSYGYATLGVVGFDGRYDYKPIGGVVNLAARLCAKAQASQVLLDHATYAETAERYPSTPVSGLELKGYAGEARAYALQR